MMQEVKRSIENSDEYAAEQEKDAADGQVDYTRGDQAEPKTFEWLWAGRFCVGKIAIIGGVKERGKSLITIDLAARITRGGKWPDGVGHAPQGSVIMLALAEDDLEDTVLPRFMAARGDRSKVYFVNSVVREGDDRREKIFSLHSDIKLLERMIDEIGDVKAIVIDPISSYMGIGQVDTFRESDVRGILSPLKVMANRTGVAVFAVRHFSKNDKVEVLNRFLDSVAFVNAARHVYVSMDHPFEEDEMLFMPCANNLAKRGIRGLSYRIAASREVMTSTGGIYPPYILWDPEPVNMTVNQVNDEAKKAKGRPGEQSEMARKFLIEMLENGRVETTVVEEAAEKMSFSGRTMDRVRTELGIVSKRHGSKWYLSLPEKNT